MASRLTVCGPSPDSRRIRYDPEDRGSIHYKEFLNDMHTNPASDMIAAELGDLSEGKGSEGKRGDGVEAWVKAKVVTDLTCVTCSARRRRAPMLRDARVHVCVCAPCMALSMSTVVRSGATSTPVR